MNAGVNQFFGRGPFEDVDDSADPLVNGVPAKPRIDQGLSKCLEAERAEVGCDRFAVELPERSEGIAEVGELLGRRPFGRR